ncbi:uncharacterized protein LOC126843899 isoform X2 [Adelges cooleyi]|uniref:uncharacterized protein LOC126843899 isoform X2 n=1 Tax=Adelges cooleyi TaxID=133065 RepID=UPI00217F4578|nr:uncharacterized protein LOC126843899 isoform X2 [Adelges cooleyi]
MVTTNFRTMICLWMVALLVLSFGTSKPAGANATAVEVSADLVPVDVANITDISTIGCKYKGRSYEQGSTVITDQPCLKCTCNTGSLVCHLQVCPELPDPPPQGCLVVHKRNKCCAHLQCFYGPPSINNNTQMNNTSLTTTTDSPSSLSSRMKDCRINGRLISLGEPVIGVARSSCETCFCINGQVRCDKVICPAIRTQISPNCGPVYTEGHCCPTSYNCAGNNKNESNINITTVLTSPDTTAVLLNDTSSTTPTTPTATYSPPTSSPSTEIPGVEIQTEAVLVTEPAADNVRDPLVNLSPIDPAESRHGVSSMTGDDGLNITEKSNAFEFDYDEPTLPPSLPNLKIIPFVAADAVVDEPREPTVPTILDTYLPVERIYNVSDVDEPPVLVANNFSPPIETEGGFVPKEPLDDTGYVLTTKLHTTTERVTVKPTVVQTEEPIMAVPLGSGWCVSNGKKYKHGELLTDPSACNICVCFESKIVCQENCPAVKVGCQRVSDPENSTCCGRIVCNEPENNFVTERRQEPAVQLTEATPVHSSSTMIRNPIIEHIVHNSGPTVKSPVRNTLSTTVKSAAVTSPKTTSASPVVASTLKTITTPSHSTTVQPTVPSVPTTEKPLEDEDYSFESMFSFLFSGEAPEPPSTSTARPIAPPLTTTTTAAATATAKADVFLQQRTDEDVGETVQFVDVKPAADGLKNKSYADVPKHHAPTAVEPPRRNSDKPANDSTVHKDVGETYKVDTRLEPVHGPPAKPSSARVRPHADLKENASFAEVGKRPETKPHAADPKRQSDVQPPSEIEQHAEFEHRPEIKVQTDAVRRPEAQLHHVHTDFKHQPDTKPYFDSTYPIKPSSEPKHAGVTPHAELKTHPSDFRPLRPLAEIKPHSDAKPHLDSKKTPDVVNPLSDFKSTPHAQIKSNPSTTAKPVKAKPNTELNTLASMLRISGCNIYGRMYRVGKIITELSTPCLQCMCTDTGVQCNQLKC